MTHNNSELGNAFPTAVRQDALIALAEFPEFPKEVNWQTFVVRLAGEEVSIPVRVYHDPELIDTLRLSALQKELVDCLLTRHHNDFVRQRHLERIICSDNIWIPPFVIQLIGEYVIDILRIIQHHQSDLNLSIYEHFVRSNPEFITLTERRVMSYWNEYYRRWGHTRNGGYEYVGFRLVRFLKSLANNARSI